MAKHPDTDAPARKTSKKRPAAAAEAAKVEAPPLAKAKKSVAKVKTASAPAVAPTEPKKDAAAKPAPRRRKKDADIEVDTAPLEPTAAPSALPIEPEDLRSRIAARAYLISEARAFAPGHEVQDWLQAEREILGAAETD